MDWQAVWAGLGAFIAQWHVLLTVIGIVVGAFVVRWLLLVILRRSIERVITGVKKTHNVEETQELASAPLHAARIVQRTRTLGTVINSVLTVVVMGAALVLVLDVLGVPVLGILGAAGVVAAGLAFGAQNLVKDILNGMFMVFEDQFGIGDVVDLGVASGTVESVGVRITSIRDVNGTLWHVRNGEILRVGNKSQGWARVIIDLPVPYHADLDEVKATILDTAKELATDPQWRRKVLETPEIWGVESVTAEALVVRLVIKTRSPDQWDIARELRMRIKLALDGLGVNVPSLNRMVLDDRRPAAAKTAKKADEEGTA
ncbi:small conductance mechanosensitive channel [Cryobacterium mesophilum]|uniref:Mechanosensitive ion channel n=1 Tax=Terrimesophilobacter mesophilus TaxID=433647 RepID=A0A4R8V7U3_9MICO|nr:mechanosensitive ion channel domain-containing protein [Terrimesophilobacter mesophilus]MBB5632362.1 small conductance mechanosensitive channel [Terrimesophilobacter mesophilus]TFB79201.1 mechanosensitive ion channel [Terrimesophilobacter mesophilus]